MATHKINQADIKDWAKNYKGELFDGILCDPPYELGFMGKSWDSSGIAFDVEMWQDIFKLLKPGGHLLAFSGSRTYHRMAVAIEDAGFEIRDMIEWVYGSGFPKSLNIGKAVDKIQGNERVETGEERFRNVKPYDDENGWNGNNTTGGYKYTKGTSEWEGYGTALKPAHEPICMARKPLDSSSICENCEGRGDVNIGAKECWVCNGTGKIKSKKLSVAENVLKYGTGGLNIDGTRVGTEDNRDRPASNSKDTTFQVIANRDMATVGSTLGRFPANLIHDGSDEVEAVFPQTKSGGGQKNRLSNQWVEAGRQGIEYKDAKEYSADSGSASRYFYTAKASKRERNAGLEGFENHKPMYESHRPNYENTKGIETPYAGAGRTGNANQNHHPTVKPLSLTKYLATLIKPPSGGRLLVPFSGSGSEMIGALQAGWEYVEGVELTEEYIPIAEARIKYWLSQVEEGDKQGTLL